MSYYLNGKSSANLFMDHINADKAVNNFIKKDPSDSSDYLVFFTNEEDSAKKINELAQRLNKNVRAVTLKTLNTDLVYQVNRAANLAQAMSADNTVDDTISYLKQSGTIKIPDVEQLFRIHTESCVKIKWSQDNYDQTKINLFKSQVFGDNVSIDLASIGIALPRIEFIHNSIEALSNMEHKFKMLFNWLNNLSDEILKQNDNIDNNVDKSRKIHVNTEIGVTEIDIDKLFGKINEIKEKLCEIWSYYVFYILYIVFGDGEIVFKHKNNNNKDIIFSISLWDHFVSLNDYKNTRAALSKSGINSQAVSDYINKAVTNDHEYIIKTDHQGKIEISMKLLYKFVNNLN